MKENAENKEYEHDDCAASCFDGRFRWRFRDGSDPLDPSDGGADWDGDGLTNAEETAQGTDPTNPDTDNDGLPTVTGSCVRTKSELG